MISKALQGFAIMQSLWSEGSDFIEIYAKMSLPFVERNHSTGKSYINENDLKNYFLTEYGIDNLSLAASKKILERLKKKKILQKEDHNYFIIESNLFQHLNEKPKIPDNDDKFNKVVNEIKILTKSIYNFDPTSQEVTFALTQFLAARDGELILEQKIDFQNNLKKKKNSDTKTQKIRQVISKYIIEEESKNSESYSTLLEFATGHMIASVVAMDDYASFDGSLPHLTVYFDSPLIFALIGLTHPIETQIVNELIDKLKSLKVSIKIVNEHFKEVKSSIGHAIGLLKAEFPDKSKANRVYFMATQYNLSPEDLNLKLNQVKSILDKNGIEIESAVPKSAGRRLIMKDDLETIIKQSYKMRDSNPIQPFRLRSIERDAKALEHIIQVRESFAPELLLYCKAILVTTNLTLCRINYNEETNYEAGIPVCMTSTDMATILWGARPSKNSNLNKFKLARDCVKNITLKPSIIRKFYNELKSKHKQKEISDADYLNASSSKLVESLLLEITLNNEQFYTDETAQEVLHRLEEFRKIEKKEYEEKDERQQSHLRAIADCIGNTVSTLIGLILLALVYINKFCFWPKGSILGNIISALITLLFISWGVLNWLNILPRKDNVRKNISNFIYRLLSVK